MADRGALKLVGWIFASVTIAVMLTATIVVKGYADGVYKLGAPIESSNASPSQPRSAQRL
ncbi:hypothetical protein [Bradyrhizobium sp. Tv2a-2]|jgi:hypothetical protein|uniref:hypothetical protein n=1 Tax=Bradyrhizobium sp. Tv2a-2 TaxID=113395 RepID=UPI000412B4F5|nr:hypothetical protein [Bradyrhizobium sp. Tv2a-2]